MPHEYKPEGYTSVAPYLILDGAAGTIDFLVRVFDAVELRRFMRDGERILHAEVRIDDTVLMLADGTDTWTPAPAHVHVYVQDVDATWKRALAAGGEAVMEPVQQQGDTDRRGGVKDAAGTTWWIATKAE